MEEGAEEAIVNKHVCVDWATTSELHHIVFSHSRFTTLNTPSPHITMASQSSVDDGDAAVPKLTAVSSSEEEEEEDEDVEEEYVEETQPLLDAASRGPRRRHRGGTKLPQPQHQDSFLRQTQQPEQGQQGSDDATGSGSEHPGLMQLYSVGIEELERRTLLLQAVYMVRGSHPRSQVPS